MSSESPSSPLISIASLADLRLEIPDEPFPAILFDCDGTLVDSMPLHYVAWVDALNLHQAPYPFTEETFYSLAGVREQDTVLLLNERHGASVDPDGVAESKMEMFHRPIPEAQAIEPVAALARACHGKLPLGVVSGSEEETVVGCLKATGLIDLFDTIITPRLVKKGKPAPDMFLLAAERLGVPPEQCLVLEDGQSGIDAAHAAGMKTVFVPRTLR